MINIGKIELTKGRLVIAASAGIMVLALAAYLVFYAPLIRQLRAKCLACESCENELLECRNIIQSAKKISEKRTLMTEEEIAHAMNELTTHGKLKGVNFVSISPKEVKKKGTDYKILPVEIKLESTGKQLGVLLGSLDELKKGLVKVKSFDIVPDKEDPEKLFTDLVVEIYFSGK